MWKSSKRLRADRFRAREILHVRIRLGERERERCVRERASKQTYAPPKKSKPPALDVLVNSVLSLVSIVCDISLSCPALVSCNKGFRVETTNRTRLMIKIPRFI